MNSATGAAIGAALGVLVAVMLIPKATNQNPKQQTSTIWM